MSLPFQQGFPGGTDPMLTSNLNLIQTVIELEDKVGVAEGAWSPLPTLPLPHLEGDTPRKKCLMCSSGRATYREGKTIYIFYDFYLTFILYYIIVERIYLSSLGREYARLKVVAADLGHRHKSDDFNSFLMHLFF